jgi:serine/threonine-protein phosphatase 2A regulatory subunit A
MAPALDMDVIRSEVLAVVLSLAEDRIPNIRFNVAKALEVLALSLSTSASTSSSTSADVEGAIELIRNGIEPALRGLMGDKDADVRFFAEKGNGVVEGLLSRLEVLSGNGGGEISQEVVMTDA